MNEMSGTRISVPCLLFLILTLWSSWPAWCDDGDEPDSEISDSNKGNHAAAAPIVSSLIYSQFSNITKVYNKEINKALGYCINDV